MEKYIITINRQFGSLGRPIAKHLSELLGIEYYDRDIVEKVAQKMNLPVSIISSEEESAKKSFFKMQFPLGKGTTDTQDKIYDVQRKIIDSIADKESCIIVGRCSDYILHNYPRIMRIYIYAPYEERLKNCINNLHMTNENASKMIHEVDHARDAYHLRYAGYLPSDLNHNDLLIDSSFLGIDKTAEQLAFLIKNKFN